MNILPQDFDNAVKQDWDTETCLLQQASLRETGKLMDGIGQHYIFGGVTIIDDHPAHKAMLAFDENFQRPGDESKPSLQALRASLPITI